MGRTNRYDDDSFEDEDFDAFLDECDSDHDVDLDGDLPGNLQVVAIEDIMEDQWLDGSYEPAE